MLTIPAPCTARRRPWRSHHHETETPAAQSCQHLWYYWDESERQCLICLAFEDRTAHGWTPRPA